MRIWTLFLMFLGVSLSVSAHAQELQNRSICDRATTLRERANGLPAPRGLIGRNISNVRSELSQYRVSSVSVSGAEPRGTIVNQLPKPGEPTPLQCSRPLRFGRQSCAGGAAASADTTMPGRVSCPGKHRVPDEAGTSQAADEAMLERNAHSGRPILPTNPAPAH